MRVEVETLGRIINQSNVVGELLASKLEAFGRSLHDKIDDVESKIPIDYQKKLRFVASIRNKVAHEPEPIDEILAKDCLSAIAEIRRWLESRPSRSTGLDESLYDTSDEPQKRNAVQATWSDSEKEVSAPTVVDYLFFAAFVAVCSCQESVVQLSDSLLGLFVAIVFPQRLANPDAIDEFLIGGDQFFEVLVASCGVMTGTSASGVLALLGAMALWCLWPRGGRKSRK